MGRTISLGQESGASINITADGKTLTWTVPPDLPDPVRLWVTMDGQPRKLQAEGRGGVESPPWVTPGHMWGWEITAGENDALQAKTYADTRNGFPLTQVAVPLHPQPVSLPVASQPGVTAPASWFEQESLVSGVPNMYLALGGGLLLVMMLKKK